jgi:hypothetical protein
MADRPRTRESKSPTTPRWVKVFAIIAAVVVVLVVVVALLGGGEHGPSRHLPEGDNPRGHAPPAQHGPQ